MKFVLIALSLLLCSEYGIASSKVDDKLKKLKVRKVPKSLFLIKRKIDQTDFGEPTIYPFELQQRVISYDKRLEDPLAPKL